MPAPSPLAKVEMITPQEAAGILRISTDLMYDIIRGRRGNNRPPAVKVGRLYRIPADEFRAWMKKRKP